MHTIQSSGGEVQAASSSMHTALGSAGEKGAAERGREKTLHYAALRNWHHLDGTRSSFFCLRPIHRSLPTMRSATVRRVASTSSCRDGGATAPRMLLPALANLLRIPTAQTTRRRDIQTARGADYGSICENENVQYLEISHAFLLMDYFVLSVIREKPGRRERTCLRGRKSFEIEKQK